MESIIDNIRNILRNDGVCGLDSIHHCIVFIFNRLLTEDKCESINFDKIYAFDNIIKNEEGEEIGEADLYNRIWNNDENSFIGQMITKLNYKNIDFKIKRMSNLKKIYLLLADLDINELHTKYDILGTIYELHLKSGSTGGGMRDLGQYYTHRSVINYMIELCNPSYENKCIESVLDPSMGTGGFLSMYIKYYNDNFKKVNWKKNKQFIHGYDIDENVTNMALLNMLLESGEHMNATLKQTDTLTCDLDCGKVDIILANEPMGLKGIDYKNCSDAIRKVGIKGTKAEPLFLNLMFESLKENGRCAVVVPDGILFGDSTQQKETRKYLVEKFNLKKVIALDGSFFLNTGVKTSVLFFVNNGKTKKVEFSNLKLNKDETVEEESAIKVKYDKIVENGYSLFVNKYTNKVVKMEGIKYMKMKDFCKFLEKGKRKSKDGLNKGKYPLYYCSILGNLWLDEYDFEDEAIVINSTNGSGKCEIYYCNGKYSVADSTMRFNSKDEKILTKYLFYYLKLNKKLLEDRFRGSNQKQITRDDLMDIEIPIIQLDEQNELVAKLDDIYDYMNNAKKLIEQMKNQIKYYVESKTMNEKNVKFGDILKRGPNGKTNSTEINDGKYPFYSACKNNPIGTHNKYDFDDDNYFLFAKSGGNKNNKTSENIGIGKFWLVNGKCAANVAMIKFNILQQDKIKYEYLYYYFSSILHFIQNMAYYTTGNGNINMEELNNINIRLPSIEKQKEIVKHCDEMTKAIETLEKSIIASKQMMNDLINHQFDENKNEQKNDIEIESNETKKVVKKKNKEQTDDEDDEPKKVTKKKIIKKNNSL